MLSRFACAVPRVNSRLQLISTRHISLAAQRLAGHHDHHPPVPEPYVPQPRTNENTDIFGRKQLPRISTDSHEHSSSDYFAYVGGAVFVLLTTGAVILYTDLCDCNIKKNFLHRHHRNFEPKPEAKEAGAAPVDKIIQSPATSSETPIEFEKKEPPIGPTASTSKKELPEYIPYLLVGSGAAAYYASLAIRARDADAKVLMIGDETDLPYNKPPLSKELWWYSENTAIDEVTYRAGNGKLRDIFFEAKGFFVPANEIEMTEHGGVSLLAGRRVIRIDPKAKIAYLDNNESVKFGKCLLATGGSPASVPALKHLATDERIFKLRNINDYKQLRKTCEKNESVTVIGGSFLGSELAYSLKRAYPNLKVIQVIESAGPLSSVLPSFLSAHTRCDLERLGVQVHSDAKITSVNSTSTGINFKLADGAEFSSSIVVQAAGIEPDVKLADGTEIKVDPKLGGFQADSQLRLTDNIWCAGDACAYDAGVLGRRRCEHWENAQITGRLAGENMTQGNKDFWYQPSYFTKFGNERYISAVGDTDSSLPTYSVFAEQSDSGRNMYDRGVTFYEQDGRIVGVLLINVFGAGLDVARRLIDEKRPISDAKELAKIFELWTPEQPEPEKQPPSSNTTSDSS